MAQNNEIYYSKRDLLLNCFTCPNDCDGSNCPKVGNHTEEEFLNCIYRVMDVEDFRDATPVELPVSPDSPWIPVSVREPNKEDEYIVTVKNLTGYAPLDKNVITARYYKTTSGRGSWDFKGWEDNKVIAWMPVPTEYKE